MNKRDINYKILSVFCIASATVVTATWVVSEKFISHGWGALAVNILLGMGIAFLFTKHLDNRLNNSADFLIRKLHLVRQGDLTQRFQEDPDEILPYGLSRELGDMMNFFRDNIGKMWKSTVTLTRLLDRFIQSSEDAINQIRRGALQVEDFGDTLERIKSSGTNVVRLLESLKTNGPADQKAMDQVLYIMQENDREFEEKKSLINTALIEVKGLKDVLKEFTSAEKKFLFMTKCIGEINKVIGRTVRQTNLVSLNTSIDGTRAGTEQGENFDSLNTELEKVIREFNDFAARSSQMASQADMKIKEINLSLRHDSTAIEHSLTKMEKADRFVEKLKETGRELVRGQAEMADRVSGHYREMNDLESGVKKYLQEINASLNSFDQLSTGLKSTLITFDKIEEGIVELKKALRDIEGFRKTFSIG